MRTLIRNIAFGLVASLVSVNALQAGAKQYTKEELEEAPALELLGKPAPTFALDDLGGTKIDLQNHLKKDIVVLDFWATWCPPCRMALPIVTSVTESMKDKGVVFYAIDQGETPDQIKEYLDSVKFKPNVILDQKRTAGKMYKLHGIPQTVIIGKDGTVQAVHIGFGAGLKEELTEQLETLAKGENLVAEDKGDKKDAKAGETKPEATGDSKPETRED